MPHAKIYKTRGGGHVSIYVPWRSDPIEIQEGGTLETDDKDTLDALKNCTEVEEVKPAAKTAKPTLRDKREA